MNLYNEISNNLMLKKNIEYAEKYKRFFKTNKEDYGGQDIFIGVKVPEIRKIAKKYQNINFETIKYLLKSEIHEYRHCGLIILVNKYEKTKDTKIKEKIFNFYTINLKYINNWDLVDCSCYKIVGNYLYNNIEKIDLLYNLANSNDLWERRIAIISTFYFIKNNNFKHTLKISKILLNDKEDLINKAVGWMIREIGNKNKKVLLDFINSNIGNIPNITLRYALEKFDKEQRIYYYNLNKKYKKYKNENKK